MFYHTENGVRIQHPTLVMSRAACPAGEFYGFETVKPECSGNNCWTCANDDPEAHTCDEDCEDWIEENCDADSYMPPEFTLDPCPCFKPRFP